MKELLSITDLRSEIDRNIQALEERGVLKRLSELEVLAAADDFWQDSARATLVMQEIADLKKEIDDWEMMQLEVEEAGEHPDEVALHRLNQQFTRLEAKMYLSGPYDKNAALMSLHAGTGGADAMDWCQMLLRMYLRYAQAQGWQAVILHQVDGEEAGIKSVTIEVTGLYAYGFLKNEAGTHRLVRKSPFNAKGLRQTSFAMVEVTPVIEQTGDISIREEDLRIDVFRASGAGGQHVNKTESAVRITHMPTGIVVSCQSERSQHQNKDRAMKVLRSKLALRAEEAKLAQLKQEKGETTLASWGTQIRSYVLAPYQLVKDHRTDYETAQTEKVLDGEIQEFIDAHLRMTKK